MVINISREIIENEEGFTYVEYTGPSLRVGDYRYMLDGGEVFVINHNYFVFKHYTNSPTLKDSEIEPNSLENILSFYPKHLHPFIKINTI